MVGITPKTVPAHCWPWHVLRTLVDQPHHATWGDTWWVITWALTLQRVIGGEGPIFQLWKLLESTHGSAGVTPGSVLRVAFRLSGCVYVWGSHPVVPTHCLGSP